MQLGGSAPPQNSSDQTRELEESKTPTTRSSNNERGLISQGQTNCLRIHGFKEIGTKVRPPADPSPVGSGVQRCAAEKTSER
ncbi:hypothetical protein Q8A67_007057 [Cirrhinus molitorella]|uniref:Uncharacterized protein n=1 Tax=Cirrhinus molitorella TaxID=172907 RepID=A0AA88PZR4_9TELE|nr:hypothetical protein Q8A67_007057 [Cirrhinus molitorella]